MDHLEYDHCFTEKSDLPDVDAVTVSGHGISTSLEAEDAHLSGTAAVVDCTGCSGGTRVGGLRGGDRAAAEFTVSVPADGTYRLDIAYVYGSDPRTSYYPTGFVAVGDAWVSDRIRFTPSPDSRTPATHGIDVPLRAGENHVRLANPMTDLDVERDNFARMRDALRAAGRPIVYSINPNTLDGTSLADIANLWRTTQDIKPLWHSTSWYRGVDDIISENGPLADATGLPSTGITARPPLPPGPLVLVGLARSSSASSPTSNATCASTNTSPNPLRARTTTRGTDPRHPHRTAATRPLRPRRTLNPHQASSGLLRARPARHGLRRRDPRPG